VLRRAGWLLVGIAVMMVPYFALDRYRFPPEVLASYEAHVSIYLRPWPGHPVIAVLALLFSTGTSVFLYAPAVVPGLRGLITWTARDRRIAGTFVLGALAFGGFIVSITFFKGDPTWGPRYLTPLFAALWLFAPAAVSRLRKPGFAVFVIAGVLVQVLALTVEPHRLFVEHRLPNAWSALAPELLFRPSLSHLVQRPREIADILTNSAEATAYSPSWSPTGAPPFAEALAPSAITHYQIFAALRPWWISQRGGALHRHGHRRWADRDAGNARLTACLSRR
jgi:hypothetical protein